MQLDSFIAGIGFCLIVWAGRQFWKVERSYRSDPLRSFEEKQRDSEARMDLGAKGVVALVIGVTLFGLGFR